MFRILPRRLFIQPQAAVTRLDATAATLRIDGLVCTACAARVRRRLERIDGVRSARVDLDRGEAFATYDPGCASHEALVAAVDGAVLFPKARQLLATLAHFPAGRALARQRQAKAAVGRGLQTPTEGPVPQ